MTIERCHDVNNLFVICPGRKIISFITMQCDNDPNLKILKRVRLSFANEEESKPANNDILQTFCLKHIRPFQSVREMTSKDLHFLRNNKIVEYINRSYINL